MYRELKINILKFSTLKKRLNAGLQMYRYFLEEGAEYFVLY